MSRLIVRPITMALRKVEEEYLKARDAWPRPGWVQEYISAFVRLREIGEHLDQELSRQDITFRAERRLRLLHERCVWLLRRIGREVFFRTELAIEQALRSRIPPEAYALYLHLVEIQGLEQEFGRLSNGQLLERLYVGTIESTLDLDIPVIPR